jgi:hypothetical protein
MKMAGTGIIFPSAPGAQRVLKTLLVVTVFQVCSLEQNTGENLKRNTAR